MSKQHPFVGKWKILDTKVDALGDGLLAFYCVEADASFLVSGQPVAVYVAPAGGGAFASVSDRHYMRAVRARFGFNVGPDFEAGPPHAINIRIGDRLGLEPSPCPSNATGSESFGLWSSAATAWDPLLAWVDPKLSAWETWHSTLPSFGLLTPGRAYAERFLGGKMSGGDFTGVDLSEEDYGQCDLSNSCFDGCIASKTDFQGANLAGARFGKGAALQGTNFWGADLTNAVFSDCDLTDAWLNRVRDPNTKLTGTQFVNCNLTRAYFQGGTLSAVKFENCNLTGAYFKQTTLSAVKFVNCNFAQAQFTEAKFSDAVGFTRSTFDETDFWGADLTGQDFHDVKSLDGCRFDYANLTQANFDKVPLPRVKFVHANLSETNLTHTDLRTADFGQPPSFSHTNFSGSTIDYAQIGPEWSFLNLTRATITNLPDSIPQLKARSVVLADVQLSNIELNKADFTQADLHRCDLSGSNLTGAVFDGASLQGAVLSGAILENVNLKGADLTGTKFTGAFLTGLQVSLEGAVVILTDFANAYLVGAKFVDVKDKACQGASFAGACLVNARFNGADCRVYESAGARASFHGACLQGADFTDARLDGADLSGAAVASAAGTIEVTTLHGWPPTKITKPISWPSPTLGIEAATDTDSVCPNDEKGPCTASKQVAKDPPTKWPAT